MYYIKRYNDGILVKGEFHELLIKTGIKSYLNNLCMDGLSTFDGRRKAITKLIMQKNNVPIYVSNKIFVYPTKSLREYDMLFINYHEVLSYKKIAKNKTLFVFNNLEELVVEVSINKIIKQHQRIELVYQYLDNII